MRLVDIVLRQGHLSEPALAEAIMTGTRPAHLDHCELCGARAVEMNRWLETVRDVAIESADEAFPPERLAAQQAQILRRLEQLDEPARVIAFPTSTAATPQALGRRRVASAWVGLAAAAGLVIGAIGGQISARLDGRHSAAAAAPTVAAPAKAPIGPLVPPVAMADSTTVATTEITLVGMDLDDYAPPALQTLDAITPTLVARSAR